MPEDTMPQVAHIYQNHHLDSTRWDRFQPRDDDIVIATSYKSGTTWMQEIVGRLVFLGQEPPPRSEASPWLDARWNPLDEVLGQLEAQTHRRYIKTHLALDGLPFYPQVKYIVVARDARDVFMSLWNHYSNYTDEVYTRFNETPGRVGPPMPRCPDDLHELWRSWISQGWFAWEREGYPFWGNMHHTQTWWNFRHLDNILLVHFNDLLADLPAAIRRVAAFLGIPISDEAIAAVAQASDLSAMRNDAEQRHPIMAQVWKGGAQTFFFKGTNGRWRGVLSPEELALYERARSQVLTPDCARWLERDPEPHS